jgi:UDPglucose 6-dehydrogenase
LAEVTVIGLGYVGLAAALSFAQSGIPVYGNEISTKKVASIRNGQVPYHERGIDNLLKECLAIGTFEVGCCAPSF